MDLRNFLEKNQQAQLQIFDYFFVNGQSILYKDLADKLSVSAPTLQKEIGNLADALTDFHSEASLCYSDNDRLCLVLPDTFSVKHFLYSYHSQAIKFQMIEYLFFHREESMTKMMIDLKLSEASLFRHLKAINQLLAEFQIQIKNKRMVGDEGQIRSFFFQFFWQSYPEDKIARSFQNSTSQYLTDVIQTQTQQTFAPSAVGKLALWLGIMENRFDFRGKQQHNFSKEALRMLEEDKAYQILRNILGRYSSRFAVSWSVYEAVYLYLFLFTETIFSPEQIAQSLETAFFVQIKAANQHFFAQTADHSKLQKKRSLKLQAFLTSIHLRLQYFPGEVTGIFKGPYVVLPESAQERIYSGIEAAADILQRQLSKTSKQALLLQYAQALKFLQMQKSKEFIVSYNLSANDLHMEFIRQFLEKQLAAFPKVKRQKNEEQICDLLIATEKPASTNIRYKKLFLLTGSLDSLEEERLRAALEELGKETQESELS